MIWKYSDSERKRRSVGRRVHGRVSAIGGAVIAVLGIGIATAACARMALVVTPRWSAPIPSHPVVYTATRCVRALAVGKDGAIWAATEGGILRWHKSDSEPRVWTTANGLISNDIRSLTMEPGGEVIAASVLGTVRITAEGKVIPVVGEKRKDTTAEQVTATIHTASDRLTATPASFSWTYKNGAPKDVPLPDTSRASHISALCLSPQEKVTYIAGLYGDGVYALTLTRNQAPRWERLALPDDCRFVTALNTLPNGQLLIGTRHEGVFLFDSKDGSVTPLNIPNALPSGDIYGLAAYGDKQDRLFATTFDQGIVEVSADGPVSVHPDVAQGRALVPFGDRLYVLGADHGVRAFDGKDWNPAWPKGTLRRAEVFSLAADPFHNRLLIGGWGGWAEWDGQNWQQHWSNKELSGESITAVAADKEGNVWIGTQRRGLFRCQGDTCTAFQEAQGLTDDWVTALAVSSSGRLLVGTWAGGLLERDGERLVPRFTIDKWPIRGIAFDGENALAATPVGVYQESTGGTWTKLAPHITGGTEAQTLLPVAGGVWIGTRNGLAFVKNAP